MLFAKFAVANAPSRQGLISHGECNPCLSHETHLLLQRRDIWVLKALKRDPARKDLLLPALFWGSLMGRQTNR
jgi:hypothetical protein